MDPNILWWCGLGVAWLGTLTGAALSGMAWRRTQEFPTTTDIDNAVESARRAAREVHGYVEEFTVAIERMGRQNARLTSERARLEKTQRRRLELAGANSAGAEGELESGNADEFSAARDWLQRTAADA